MNITRVAIVTGGTRGMGQAISVKLAEMGNIVIAIYQSNEQSAKETKNMLTKFNEKCDVMKLDVSDYVQVEKTINEIGEKYGRIDILVNNAGIFDFSYIEDTTPEYLDRVINVNFKSQFYTIKAVISHMKKNKYGRIVNASSISGNFSDVGLVSYAASKAGVNMMTKIASAELAPYGITVNAYAPGIIHTDMTDSMIQERGDIQVEQISLHRFGTGNDVSALVGFLASEESGYVTGEIIGVDGGFFKVQNAYRAYEHAKF